MAGGVGYLVGDAERERAQRAEVQRVIQEQFSLGLQDLELGRYEIARQRFEYIIRLDPNFPEAAERLAEALLGLREPPPAAATPALTPTPNLAPVEEMLRQAQAALSQGDWSLTVETLLALRAKDPGYEPVAVDGLLYAALRNRGIQRISQDHLLEEGMYDLSLAASFAPLDEEAANWRGWAELYLTANSYFGLNWEQAVFYFELVSRVAPGIRADVPWKYAVSLRMYAQELVAAGDPCLAEELMAVSIEVLPDEAVAPTVTAVYDACQAATAPPPAATATPTPQETPTETPTPEG
jgi:tetratricopeptide (TPR) repeat protein